MVPDEISDLGTKDSGQDLAGKWIVELPELSAMGRSDIKQVKVYLTLHVRPLPRQLRTAGRATIRVSCVFAGTTNESAYLGDQTGNRRFWPAKIGDDRPRRPAG